jgi:hypothetical protein
LDGNPSVILLLFAPTTFLKVCDATGNQLRSLAPAFASRRAGARFLGYLQQQRQRMLGERGQKGVTRAALVEQFGYDTKYASHIIRLGYQGVEYLETGQLTLPLPGVQRQRCIDIRAGRVDQNEMLTEAGELEQKVKDLCDTSPLPAEPDVETVQEWILTQYLQNWKADDVQNDLAKARRIKDLHVK